MPVSPGVCGLPLRRSAGNARHADRSTLRLDAPGCQPANASSTATNGGNVGNLNALRTQLLPWEFCKG